MDAPATDLIPEDEVIELTRRLVTYRTVSPPGDEAEAIHFLGDYLADAGVGVEFQEVSPNRPTVRGQSTEAAEAYLERVIDSVTAAGLLVTTSVELIVGGDATLDAEPDHQLVRTVMGAAQATSGSPQHVSGCSAGTDALILCPAFNQPAVLFEPGSFAQAHSPNEYVARAEVTAAARACAVIADRMLRARVVE